jgi:hypothetical protein
LIFLTLAVVAMDAISLVDSSALVRRHVRDEVGHVGDRTERLHGVNRPKFQTETLPDISVAFAAAN